MDELGGRYYTFVLGRLQYCGVKKPHRDGEAFTVIICLPIIIRSHNRTA